MTTWTIDNRPSSHAQTAACLGLLALCMLLVGPFIDGHFAERSPIHSHVYVSGQPLSHTHIYDIEASSLLRTASPSAIEAMELDAAPLILGSQEATAAVAVGFSGLDIYGFHTLEVLQCMVERRAGGESGVSAVTCIEGKDVWDAAADGAWWRELAEAACAPVETKPDGPMEDHCDNPALFLLEYCDGFRGAVLMLNGYLTELAYAARHNDDRVESTWFRCQGHGGEKGAYAHFSYLSLNVEEMFLTGVSQYPVERTLLTSGVLEAALTSRHEGHVRLETPWLELEYRSFDKLKWRPTATEPEGACLEVFPPADSK